MTVSELLMLTGLAPSRSEALRLIKSGGTYVNNRVIPPPDEEIRDSDFLYGKYLILRRGKKEIRGVVRDG